MPFVCPNLVQETTTVTGTGPATLLGAVTDRLDFDSQLANGDTVPYTITNGTDIEVGIGTFSTSGPTLTRTTILYSTNGGAAVPFTGGTKDVIGGLPGQMVSSILEQGAADGFLAQIAANAFARRTLTAGNGITITNGDGISGDPTFTTSYRRVEEFGAAATPGFDNATAFAAAVTWAAGETNPAAIVFGGGIYEYSVSPNWAINGLQMIGLGEVRLRYTGTGNAFILDGGGAPGVFNMRIGRFIIEAPSTANHGVYWDSVHHSMADLNVRGCGSAKAALHMRWAVVNEIRFTTSVNEDGGFYLSAKPNWGIYMETDGVNGPPSWNLFPNPIIEGTAIGCEITAAFGNTFLVGTMEACTTGGLKIGTRDNGCLFNKVFVTDFEANGSYDITCDGYGNEFHGVSSALDLIFGANSSNNKVVGGDYQDITLTSGATANCLTGFTIDRNGTIPPGEISGDLDANIVRDFTDNSNNMTTNTGLTLNPPSLPNYSIITASPFVYTNTSAVTEGVGVLPSITIDNVQYVRNGVGEGISFTWGMWEVSPGDSLIVTYPGTPPAMRAWPRAR